MSTTSPGLRERFMGATITVGLPSTVAVILSLVAGALQVLNQVVFTYSAQIHTGVAVLLVALAGMGISPIAGQRFRNALHLPGWAATLISTFLSAVIMAITSMTMPATVQAILGAIITIASALGFGPNVLSMPPPASTPMV